MDVTCQSCRASYKVDDAKIPAQGIKAKCPKCGNSFFLKKPEPPPSDDVIAVPGDAAAPGFDPFGGAPPIAPAFGGAPPPDPFAAAPPPDPFAAAPSDPFAAAPSDPFAAAPPSDPFSGGFGGAPDLGGGFNAAPAPPPDPFAAGGVFGGGFAPPAPQGDGIGGLFQAKTAFEVKKPDGTQLGPFDLFTLKQMIYEQQLDGREELLDAQGNWVPISTVEDLGEILRLTGAAGVPAAADGGGWGASSDPAPAPVGWAKHESVAAPEPPPAPVSTPAPRARVESAPQPARVVRGQAAPVPPKAAPPPAAPIAIEAIGGGKRGASEVVLIGVERVWSLTKIKSIRIVLYVVGALLFLTGTVFLTRSIWMPWFDLDKKVISDKQIAAGDRTAYSGEKAALLNSLAIYEQAAGLYAGNLSLGRLSETQAAILWRDPTRLDLKAKVEENLAKTSGSDPAVVRAKIRFALATHDAAALAAALAEAPAGDPAFELLKGEAALEKGDIEGASAAFKGALAGPGAPQANIGLARVRLKKGDFAGAKQAADAAAAAEPDNGLAKALAAYASAKSGGDAAAAKKTLIELLNSPFRFPLDRAHAARFLSILSEEAGASPAALGYAAQAVALYPHDAETTERAKRLFAARFPGKPVDKWVASLSKIRGSTQMGPVQDGERMVVEKNWPGADNALRGAVAADPTSARAHVALARMLLEVGGDAKIAEAKNEYAKAIQLDPEWAEPANALSRLEAAAKNDVEARKLADKAIGADPTKAESYQVAAASALALKDARSAEAYLRIAVELDPDSPGSWMDLGEALRLTGRPDEAIPHLEKAAALAPNLAEPRIRLGAVYETKGDYPKAGELYSQAAALEPENLKVATRAGVTFVKAGEMAQGRKRLEAAVKTDPSNAEAQYWLGIASQFGGEPEAAIDSYRAAIKYGYENVHEAHLHLAEVFTLPGPRDVEAARMHARKAIEAKPDYWQARMQLTEIAVSSNEWDEALKELKAIIPMISKLPPADQKSILERVYLKMAEIHIKQGKPRDAGKPFNDALKVNPRSAPALHGLGDLQLQAGNNREARKKFEAAIVARRDFAPPYRSLADLDNEAGNCKSAKGRYKRFLELTTDDNARKEVEALVRDLQCD